MKPTVINNTNSGNDINNYSEPNVNNNPDIHHAHHQQQPHPQQQQHPQPQSTPQGIYHDNNGLAGGGANSRRFPFYPTGFDFFDDDDMFPDSGVRSRLNRMRDPWGTWGRKRRSSQEHITPEQTQAGGVPQPSAQVPQPDEGYEDDFFPQMQQPWADATFGRGQRKRNPHLDDDDDFFSYIPQQFRQYIPNNFQFPRMRSHFARPQMAQPAPAAHSPQNRNYFPQQQPQPQQQAQQHPVHQEPHMGKPKFCDAAMQTDFDQSHPDGQAEQPNLNQHGLRNTIDMGQKTNDECDDAGPRARSAPPDQNYQNDPNQFASAQSFSSATGFPGQKPQVYAQASATPGAHAQAHAQAQTANMGTNTSPGTPNGGNLYRQYYYPFDSNNTSQANSQARQPPQQAPPQQPQTPTQEGQFIRTVPIVIESRKVPPKPKPQTPPVQQPHTQPQHQQQSPPQAHAQPQQNTQNREIPIRVEHSKTQNQAPPQPQTSPQSPPPQQQQAEPEAPKTTLPPDSITKIQAIQKEVMELMFAVEQFKGKGRDKEYIYLDEMLTRNLIKLDDIETDGKENIRLARKEAIKCIQASLCVLEMKADGRIPENESKPEESNTKGEVEEVASDPQPPVTEAEPTTEDTSTLEKPELPAESTTATATTTHEKTDENVTEKKDEPTETAIINDKATSSPTIEKNKEKPIDEENKSETVQEPEPAAPKANETEPAAAEGAEVKPAEST